MIVLDTHVWIWWRTGDSRLPESYVQRIETEAEVGVCAISCWEVAKLVERGRLAFSIAVEDWLRLAWTAPVVLLPLTPEVAVESSRLPGNFHRDPADQMIVATARVLDCPLMTLDGLIRAYPHVRLIP